MSMIMGFSAETSMPWAASSSTALSRYSLEAEGLYQPSKPRESPAPSSCSGYSGGLIQVNLYDTADWQEMYDAGYYGETVADMNYDYHPPVQQRVDHHHDNTHHDDNRDHALEQTLD